MFPQCVPHIRLEVLQVYKVTFYNILLLYFDTNFVYFILIVGSVFRHWLFYQHSCETILYYCRSRNESVEPIHISSKLLFFKLFDSLVA